MVVKFLVIALRPPLLAHCKNFKYKKEAHTKKKHNIFGFSLKDVKSSPAPQKKKKSLFFVIIF